MLRNRNRLDLIRVMGYLAWGIVIWLIFWLGFSLITPRTDASAMTSESIVPSESLIVHGGLPDPMSAIAEVVSAIAETVVPDDIELVVKTVICECGANEPLGCYTAVAHTIRTRAEKRSLTYEQVVLEPYQYSCWNAYIPASLEWLRDNPEEALPVGYYETIRSIVGGVFSDEQPNLFPGADHYYSACLIGQPFWVAQATFLGQIGCHKFYSMGG